MRVDEVASGAAADMWPGLDHGEAATRFAWYGPNELPSPRREHLAARVVRQLTEPMAFLLLGAAAVTGFGLGKRLDAVAILAIVLANVAIALVQEGKAARALEALRTMETPAATVRRDGVVVRIPARELVPGDVVLLAAGDRVPADVHLVGAASLEVDESILTGESLPVGKEPSAEEKDEPEAGLGDRRNMAFSGTLVVRGWARGVVVATGSGTQLGTIAGHLREPSPPTPIQRELHRMTARLGLTAVAVAIAVFGVTLLRLGVTESGIEIAFLSAAALAVAAVPEGLPTVVTVALALGVRRMAAHGSIVRRLPAVETLGSTTVILTDKTGTLTENRMRLDVVALPGRAPVRFGELRGDPVRSVAEVLALCNDATLEPATGDPMEIALLEALGASRAAAIRAAHPRIAAAPFDSERKRMATVNVDGAGVAVFVKGAPEAVVERCATVFRFRDEVESLTADAREELLARAEALARNGARVLALAKRRLTDAGPIPEGSLSEAFVPEAEEHDLTLVGLVALRDPVRPEAARAIAEATSAGIHILMVTGDHPGTALAVAREVGLAHPRSSATTGADLRRDGLPFDPLDVPVYARVDPDEKLALTEALQARGHVVAVTGDGVNDAPALRRADIGVAMGRSGSDVAREAADMVVTDDNLATIVTAVREGRGIYDNVRKVVEYLVAGNLSEILVVVAGLALFPDLGVPLLPLQLLWINLLTDGFPALALGVDPVDPGLMARAPRARADHLLSGGRLSSLLARAIVIAGASIGSLAVARYAWNEPWAHARATMFSVLVAAHLLYAFAVRRPGTGARVRINRWLVAAVAGGIGLQALVVSVPALHAVFGTATLTAREWLLVAGAGAFPTLVMRAWSATTRPRRTVAGPKDRQAAGRIALPRSSPDRSL